MFRTRTMARGLNSHRELLAVFLCLVVLGLLVMGLRPNLVLPKHKSNKQKCANHLKSIGLALIMYADDYRSFPHMKPLDQEHTEADVSRVFRSLKALQYIDSAEDFICPASEDRAQQPAKAALDKPRLWTWGGVVGGGQKPVLGFEADPELLSNRELSYTYLRRAQAVNASADTILSADKALRGVGEEPVGNHSDGFNALYADGRVSFKSAADGTDMQLLVKTLHMGPFSPKVEGQ